VTPLLHKVGFPHTRWFPASKSALALLLGLCRCRDVIPYTKAPESAYQKKIRGKASQLHDHICKEMNPVNLHRCRYGCQPHTTNCVCIFLYTKFCSLTILEGTCRAYGWHSSCMGCAADAFRQQFALLHCRVLPRESEPEATQSDRSPRTDARPSWAWTVAAVVWIVLRV
jgi:hypothetical protein